MIEREPSGPFSRLDVGLQQNVLLFLLKITIRKKVQSVPSDCCIEFNRLKHTRTLPEASVIYAYFET